MKTPCYLIHNLIMPYAVCQIYILLLLSDCFIISLHQLGVNTVFINSRSSIDSVFKTIERVI